jgi:PAS domain S-box-containing protein
MDDAAPLEILVIEDDADTRSNLRDILELDDHRVAEAASAAEALARADWERFDAVILDRRLPDAVADQLLPRLHALAPRADVIVVTGFADLDGAIAALRQGAADYILKPLNADALRASLDRLAERHRLARAKERSEAAFRNLVEAAECLIVIVRDDGTIQYLSPYTARLTGFGLIAPIGRDFEELLIPLPSRGILRAALDRAREGRPARGVETPVACRDGSPRWVVWTARRLGDDDGRAVLAVGQDITEVKRAQERALQAERLAAIGEMVAGLAHESRNAMQRSQACLEMLALADRDRPDSLGLIARVQRAMDDLHHLYEDVRGYAAPIRLEARPCDLREVWREAWTHLDASRRGREATLREGTDVADLRCVVDPFRLGQVFHNLLENALAAGRPDRPVHVTIRAEAAELDGQDALRVVVADDGPGLDAEGRRRVFDPFFTTKAKGTGLGMAIARRIVEAHGGRIAVGENSPGAVFLITLPRGNP